MANKYIQAYATEAAYNAASKPSPNVSLVYGTDKLYYNGDEHQLPTDYSTKYLTFVALEDGTFRYEEVNQTSLQYSLDGGATWTNLSYNTNTPTVASGNTIMWKSSGWPSALKFSQFRSSAPFNVEGNIMSLLYGDDFIGKDTFQRDNQFKYLFSTCSVVSAEHLVLPKTTRKGCYYAMFVNCTGLTTPPQLPATTLADECYVEMFYNCPSLATAPQLPATTLPQKCYWRMFGLCTSLTTAPTLPAPSATTTWCYGSMFLSASSLSAITCLATNIASNATTNWVDGVSSSGTFTKAASMANWPSGVSGIPTNWTVQDYQGN